MTPEERAKAIADLCLERGHSDYTSSPPCEACTAEAIRAAVAEARQARGQVAGVPWYFEVHVHDASKATIYDSNDYALVTVEGREADDGAGMTGYTAAELARVIVEAVNAHSEP